MNLLAGRFDDHPALEFVDVSGYGIWGDGHHYGQPAPLTRDHGQEIFLKNGCFFQA